MREFGVREATELLHPAEATDSKYTRGVVGLLTGSELYPGAAVLGVEGAARTGAGYVRYVGPRRCQDLILARRPETVLAMGKADAWVIGSGMESVSENDPRYSIMMNMLDPAINTDSSVIVDAGALSTFVQLESHTGDQAHDRFVVTPHSGELARMLTQSGYSVTHSDVDASSGSRLEWAQRARDVLGCTVVLKGAKTLIVPVDREPLVVSAPTHWLATAGTGDVLAGIMGTVVAQLSGEISKGVVSLAQAAALAVVLHGHAAGLASATMNLNEEATDSASLLLTSRVPGQPLVAADIARAVPVVIGALLALQKGRQGDAPVGFQVSAQR